jgi:hypothetical protein
MIQFQEPPQEQDFPTNVPVPTFRHGNRLLEAAGIDESEQADKFDAFLLYSNDEVRMRTLSGGMVRADQESTSTETEGDGGTRKRKTRISFELHPSVFIEDLLLAGDDDDSFVSDFDDIHEDAVKAMAEDPQAQVNALVFLLFGGNLHANHRAPKAA